MRSVDAVKALDRGKLVALVAWAIRSAMAWAQANGLHEGEVVSEVLHAIDGALRTHAGGTTVSDHVRRRVRGALLDATEKEHRRRDREVFLDDLAASDAEHDEDGPAWAAGVEGKLVGSPEESLLRREAQGVLDREVERLPRADRRLYELRHRRGLTWDEICAETGIPVRTLGQHDKRIRDHLTAVLRAYQDEA